MSISRDAIFSAAFSQPIPAVILIRPGFMNYRSVLIAEVPASWLEIDSRMIEGLIFRIDIIAQCEGRKCFFFHEWKDR